MTEPKRERVKTGDYEGVTLDNGWYVIRRVQTEGSDGQWIATKEAVPVRQ